MTLGLLFSPVGVYLAIAVLMTVPLILNGIVSLFCFRRPRAMVTGGDAALPSISVLVPARNEERNIERCVRSALDQNYPNFEVVVLDDNSTDLTYEILCKLRDQDEKLRVLAGAALPEGWSRRAFSIQQLAQASKNRYLLITEASCELSPDALLMAIGAIFEYKADVVSLAPDYAVETFLGNLLVPLILFAKIAFLPIALVRGSRSPWFAAADEAFLCLDRDSYFDVDGYRAVRDRRFADMSFVQHDKRLRKTLWFGDGRLACRSYRYLEPYSKWDSAVASLFPGSSTSLAALAPLLAYALIVFIAPPIVACIGWAACEPWAMLALAPYVGVVALRIAMAEMFQRESAVYALLNPLAWAAATVLAIDVAAHGARRE